MNRQEQMRFNGMDPTKFNLDVSDSELGRQIGNSMAQNVVERILHSLLPAAGLTNPLEPDRWKTGKAIEELINSRDKGFMNSGPTHREPSPEQTTLGELHFWNSNTVYKCYRLPNRWFWIKWEHVSRVIHRCAETGTVVFNECVDVLNQQDARLWERTCAHAGGLMSIYLY